MKKSYVLLLVLLSCFALPQLAFGGAWTLPEKNLWMEESVKLTWAKKGFDNEHRLNDLPRDARSWGWSTSPKVEYGITDWFTLLGGLEYKTSHYKELARPDSWGPYSVKNHGLTEAHLGGRVRIIENPVVLSAQVKAFWNINYQRRALEDVAEAPELGDRTNMLEFKGLIGKTFDDAPIRFYMGLESGFRLKQRNAAHDIPLFAEFGCWPLSWLLLKTEFDCYFLAPGTGRKTKKEYAIWRIGPSIELLKLFNITSSKEIETEDDFADSVTRTGQSLTFSTSYGIPFWGRNTNQEHEVTFKLSGQF